jgi:xylitol oxidase
VLRAARSGGRRVQLPYRSITMTRVNWGGNYAYGAERLHRPATLEELRAVVAGAPRIRVLGSRHSFNDIADSAEQVSLDALPADVVVDGEIVSFGAALRYGELASVLEREGVALHNLASLPHISVAGAVATATHGSGDALGSLASAVAGLQLVTSEGELVEARRGDDDFDGMVVGLGALGAVTRITLDVEPAYDLRQRVFEGLEWDALFEHFDEITARGDSVSVFTRWRETVDQVWVKSRGETRGDLFGARPATVDRHPIIELDPVNCTPQLGRPGPWHERLPHFRMGFTPSSGDELQSEFFLPRSSVVPALEALRSLAPRVQPVLQIAEVRTVAADTFWMSPMYGRDTVAIHFTWQPVDIAPVVAEIQAALAPYGARPHWGKVFLGTAGRLYERRDDFVRLAGRLDPRGAFRNAWLEARVLT